MTKTTVVYQGKIATAKRDDGTEQEIHVYANSSDFPGFHMVTMSSVPVPEKSKYYEHMQREGRFVFPTERVPINEKIWRDVGKALGYKFIVRKKKEG